MRRRTWSCLAAVAAVAVLAGGCSSDGSGGRGAKDGRAAETAETETASFCEDLLNLNGVDDTQGIGAVADAMEGLAGRAPEEIKEPLETWSKMMRELAEKAGDDGVPGDPEVAVELNRLTADPANAKAVQSIQAYIMGNCSSELGGAPTSSPASTSEGGGETGGSDAPSAPKG